MEYKLALIHGRKHVISFIDRKEYYFTEKIKTEDGIIEVRDVYIAKPKYLGIYGLCLCGILKEGETLKQWIENEKVRKEKVLNETNKQTKWKL